MNTILALTILVIGSSGIAAQIILLRELLVSFYGNELTVGVILANWILIEAIGVYWMGRILSRAKNPVNLFFILQFIFSLTLPASVYFARTFKTFSGIPFGEGIGISAIFIYSFLIILPVGLSHGALFSTACGLFNFISGERFRSIGKAYALEMIGTVLGGLILTYLFIPHFNSFQSVLIICLVNIIIPIFYFQYSASRKLKYFWLFSSIFIVMIFSFRIDGYLQRSSINRQWKPRKVIDYRNSPYGNIAVTKEEEQYTFFYNGLPIITTPYPDKLFIEEFGNLALLSNDDPKDVLTISHAAGGLLNEILKYGVEKVDYAELDPLVISLVKEHDTGLTRRELGDKRLNIINTDGKLFLKQAKCKYDCILIGLSNPSDLLTNRFFTREFFALARSRLNKGGILEFWLPGSFEYLSPLLRDINACVLNAARDNFKYVRIIPGDNNIFLASDSEELMRLSAREFSARLLSRGIKTDYLVPAYIEYKLDKKRLDWFMRQVKEGTVKVNTDTRPFAVFLSLSLWSREFSSFFAPAMQFIGNLNITVLFISLALAILFLFLVFYRLRNNELKIAYCVATTGFFGMIATLILIFNFQAVYGYLYQKIGILMSIFMGGVALGSILITYFSKRIKNESRLFIGFEALIIIFISGMGLFVATSSAAKSSIFPVYLLMFFGAGLVTGLEFPLASRILLISRREVAGVSGLLYGCDLLGGYFAGILGGIFFLPILGVYNTCIILILLKLSSLLILLTK
ncbi:MAG: hypothetical protein KJ818_03565 [Candidatus Omnitrophica bacterium]|nr:hypothetical protein [Candidatus Omnitrophota bacterium]